MNWPSKTETGQSEDRVKTDTQAEPTATPFNPGDYCKLAEVTKPLVVEEIVPGGPVLIDAKDYTKVHELPTSYPRPIITTRPPQHQHTPHEIPKTGERTDIQMPSGAKRFDA